MKNILLIMIAALALGCGVDQATAEEVLQDEGYHDIEVLGYAAWACSEDDTFASTFRAQRTIVNRDGTTSEREVTGTICCGVFKDCTVRH